VFVKLRTGLAPKAAAKAKRFELAAARLRRRTATRTEELPHREGYEACESNSVKQREYKEKMNIMKRYSWINSSPTLILSTGDDGIALEAMESNTQN
jgi:hypothetical protein